jgi:DNA-directed RNA polymerase specialized sigma24 family protein
MIGNIENADAILEKLILENHDTLLGFASCVLSNTNNAEDAVQDTYLVAQIKRSDMLNSLNPAGWLMKTLKNIIGDIYKRRSKMLELFVPLDENLTTNGLPINFRLEYEGIIGKKDLDLLFCIYCDELPYQEAAGKLGISLSACKKQIQRAKLKFQKAMEEDENKK